MRPSRLSLALFAVTAVVTSLACGMGKIAECNSFIEVVNKHAAELATVSSSMGSSDAAAAADGLQKMGDVCGKLEAELATLEISDEGLKPKVDEYRETAGKLKTAATSAATAAKGGQLDAALTALPEISKQATRLDELAGEVNAYCQAP